ncbi:hypothetical protein P170DRAFT_143960 [Aspergillus steynii IBT 23096]|uniref:Secreted protein n=1 Tax=Aspergillus steynii IBT 23096 TaxID=1392250 RepID=A0A2I2GC41_9EURO|nr:uncharacterized protein P170DRAFT_143960 [Aspergillus steynii IBT 23096]PLB50442.1 hypothetical protein P170DRAFT_143960 [Aspergillus steynii IBT 23096]
MGAWLFFFFFLSLLAPKDCHWHLGSKELLVSFFHSFFFLFRTEDFIWIMYCFRQFPLRFPSTPPLLFSFSFSSSFCVFLFFRVFIF